MGRIKGEGFINKYNWNQCVERHKRVQKCPLAWVVREGHSGEETWRMKGKKSRVGQAKSIMGNWDITWKMLSQFPRFSWWHPRAESPRLSYSSLDLPFQLTQVVLPPLGISFSICTMGPILVLSEVGFVRGGLKNTVLLHLSVDETRKDSAPHDIFRTRSCSGHPP